MSVIDGYLQVHVWFRPKSEKHEAAWFFMETDFPAREFPQAEYTLEEFCREVDDFWENRSADSGWLIKEIHSVPEGFEGRPLSEEEQKEFRHTLLESS